VDQLIFFGIIALFTILEGIARSKKKRDAEAQLPLPEETEWEPVREELPDRVSTPGRHRVDEADDPMEPYTSVLDRPREDRPDRGTARPAPTSSEGMIPADIWEEITALARGQEVPTRAPPPQPKPEVPLPAPRPVRRAPEPRPERPAPVVRDHRPPPAVRPERAPDSAPHRIHETHPKYGRPVHERLSRMDVAADHEVRANQDVVAVRGLLSSGRSSLRQAVILREVLGSPVSMREDPLDTGW
jgi:hypothetical protein